MNHMGDMTRGSIERGEGKGWETEKWKAAKSKNDSESLETFWEDRREIRPGGQESLEEWRTDKTRGE